MKCCNKQNQSLRELDLIWIIKNRGVSPVMSDYYPMTEQEKKDYCRRWSLWCKVQPSQD